MHYFTVIVYVNYVLSKCFHFTICNFHNTEDKSLKIPNV
jgi:hypothetical protein